MVEFCRVKELLISKSNFRKMEIHKYECFGKIKRFKSLIDYVLVNEEVKETLLAVDVLRKQQKGCG